MVGIFISYRRDDVAGQVGRLFGRLAAHYGEDFIFMDVESIRPSEQFESVIQNRIKDCDVMLLAIGPKWQAERTESSASKDFVRIELAAALGAKRPLCPLLIDRREPLEAADLPEAFQQILSSHAVEIRHSTFDTDVEALIAGLETQGVRPPPSFGRRRVEDALVAAGRPYMWFGAMSRTLSPLGAATLALGAATLAIVILAAAGWAVYTRGATEGMRKGAAPPPRTTKARSKKSRQSTKARSKKPLLTTKAISRKFFAPAFESPAWSPTGARASRRPTSR